MTITLYLYTSRTDAFRFGPEDLEEEESIKKTIRELVIPKLECDPEPVEYSVVDEGRHMVVILHKSGSKKNSVVAWVRKQLDKMLHDWARMYNYSVSVNDKGNQYDIRGVHTMMVIDGGINYGKN